MKKTSLIIFIFSFIIFSKAHAQVVKILFDASKAESSGNADWVIDANQHNLGYFNGPAVLGQGDDSNAQQIPAPSQTNVTDSTIESYWDGALSSWGIDCVKKNYEVETLPYNGQISYGNTSNIQDLSNYNVYIVCEPNILFTNAEKAAIINFVANGGSLFMISDHDMSDRNGDNWDSPQIWNDLMSNNSIQNDPFGMTFDYSSFSQTSTNIHVIPNDSILNGPMGAVSEVQWSSGTSITLNPSNNITVQGVIYKNGSAFGNTNVMCAYSYYGKGKVAAIGDSSPCDDGTGDPNDQLYDGYIQDAAGNHRKLLMNITIWLAVSNISTGINNFQNNENEINVFPTLSKNTITIKYSLRSGANVSIGLFDIEGRKIISARNKFMTAGNYEDVINVSDIKAGIYFCKYVLNNFSESVKIIVMH